ncbi:energy-coupling factor transporter transmembrane protein EcfT [Clostridium sp. WLY-B-L2]|uniref:Energy-coupling factor transporter transmembrane protein EcfT n=1 Tax=Clostridium aromativorans TaxID=2836848 RepID=A0ABS8N1D5_9CLOT|nr:energy-coupling factor transporter transmembrane component T [Clostridium aromativorans]MCC9293580.1 energy-coupling factor transporter transmembrane protein EcfT [Clostridium aromativorans]CAB1253631.1 Energy-coupling factor transporter transmembrane protein EcfT [Clostridiaceae bacterium BL-3]
MTYKDEEKSRYFIDFKQYHVLTASVVFMSMMVIIFSNDNPVILSSVYVFILFIAVFCSEKHKFKTALYYFFPIAFFIILLNVLFVSSGRTTLFYLFNRRFTLEAFIYALVMSLKFLAVIYLFIILELMVDSDRAVSYFSSIMPKSTLMLMISFKLIPSMKDRFRNLKEIYEVRGVMFDKKKAREKAASYIPVMSILLEDSMEGSFNIGEAAYVRGFLSGSRSVYERQKFKARDWEIIALSTALIIFYGTAQFKGWVQFNIYDGVTIVNFINIGIAVIFAFIVAISLTVILNGEEKKYGIYRD